VPPIILYEESYRGYKIIDGRERLKAIADFYSNRLALTGLEVELELDGCTYATLPIATRDILSFFCHSRQRKKRKSQTKEIKRDDCARYS
jgi:hypothetical protein